MIKRLLAFLKLHLFEILLLIFCIVIPYTLGRYVSLRGVLASFLFFLVLKRIHYWAFSIVFSLIAITCVLFTPIIIWFGAPPATMVGAFFETNYQESKEFLKTLPFYTYLISLLILLYGILILYLGRKKKGFYYTKKQLLITSLFCVLGGYFALGKSHVKTNTESRWELSASRVSFIGFYDFMYQSVTEYQQLRKSLSKEIKEKASWKITSVAPTYKNYVLVIGESVRRDYMSLYGFPLENSTFLKNVKGTVIEGYTAAGANTTTALLRMFLQIKNNDFVYANNIVSLAKEAGFEVYWLSNQGTVGEYDTPIAKIAALSNHYDFTKTGDYSSINYFDTVLLPTFEKRLMEKSSKNRLFIIHIMGSHEYFEDRLSNAIHYNYYNRIISAYLQTIEQTDDFLKQIYEKLQQQGEPFSMIYFSDHGLATKERESKNAWLVHGTSKEAFEIPFVQINSDDTQHKMLKVQKSGFHFLSGYAHWLGIRENSLNPEYHFLSDKNDTIEVFNQYENVPFNSLPEDPILTDEKRR